jgi:hypothetical protein
MTVEELSRRRFRFKYDIVHMIENEKYNEFRPERFAGKLWAPSPVKKNVETDLGRSIDPPRALRSSIVRYQYNHGTENLIATIGRFAQDHRRFGVNIVYPSIWPRRTARCRSDQFAGISLTG